MLVEGARSLPCRFRPAIAHNCRAYCGQVTTDRVWMERERERDGETRQTHGDRRTETKHGRDARGRGRSPFPPDGLPDGGLSGTSEGGRVPA